MEKLEKDKAILSETEGGKDFTIKFLLHRTLVKGNTA